MKKTVLIAGAATLGVVGTLVLVSFVADVIGAVCNRWNGGYAVS